jgi:hypothetical protein
MYHDHKQNCNCDSKPRKTKYRITEGDDAGQLRGSSGYDF